MKENPPTLQAVYVHASHFQPRPLPWLWPNWIPTSALTLLVSDPGVGKSLLCADLAARFSRSTPIEKADWLAAIESIQQPDRPPPPSLAHITNLDQFSPNPAAPPPLATAPWPDGRLCPFLFKSPTAVTFVAGQDRADDALIGRLRAAGAILASCRLMAGVSTQPCMPPQILPEYWQIQPLRLPTHIDQLEDMLSGGSGVRLMIIDPLTDVLECPSAPPAHALLALARLARRYDTAILATIHLNKCRHHRALYRIRGSLDYIAVARSALLLSIDPANPNRRILHQIKNSYAPLSKPLAFTIESSLCGMAASVGSHVAATIGWVEPHRTNVTNDAAPPAAGGMPSQTAPRESSSCKNVSPAVCVGMHSRTETAPRLQWDDPSTPIPFSPETLDLPGDQQSAILEAATWLQDQLAHGPRPAREILQAANLAGISRTTLLRAKPTIAAQSKQAALGKPWFWGVGSFAVPPLAPDTQVEGTLT